MDVSLSSAIVATATQQASASTGDALNVLVLKKALDMQKDTAGQMLSALTQPAPQPPLASSGALGTQVNTWA